MNKLHCFIKMSKAVGHVMLITVDGQGVPHLATAGAVTLGSGGRVFVSSCFCPKTQQNLRDNPRVSLVVWDEYRDQGYQVSGRMEIPDHGQRPMKAASQDEPVLPLSIETIMDFSQGPHSDHTEVVMAPHQEKRSGPVTTYAARQRWLRKVTSEHSATSARVH